MAKIAFNFIDYTKSQRIDGTLLDQWLSRHPQLPRISLTKTVLLEPPVYQKLVRHIKDGIACQFKILESENIELLKQELQTIDREASRFAHEIKKQMDIIARYEADLRLDQVLTTRITNLSKKLVAIKKTYTAGGMLSLLNVNTDYKNFTREKTEAEADLKRFSSEAIETQRRAAATKLNQYQAKKDGYASRAMALRSSITAHSMPKPKPVTLPIPSPNFHERLVKPLAPQPASKPASARLTPKLAPLPILQLRIPATPNRTIRVDWKDVVFDDGGIFVRYPVLFLNRYPLPESRKYLNAIKARYRFRNAPPLELVINQRTIVEVVNREVILYYLAFLTNTSSLLDFEYDGKPVMIGRFQQYTKKYYRKNLPNLFISRALKHLCQIADENSSIIPAPELVINSSGSKSIDDSFLFTLKRPSTCYIAWESTEESKATYVFQADQPSINQTLQTIYDYLVDDIVNKRQTLLCSSSLQRQLGMVTRILHTNFTDWKLQLKSYSS